MTTYVVYVQWLECARRSPDYRLKSKRLEVVAADILAASQQALTRVAGRICPSVSCIWPKV